jgi:hypothetical protein
MDGVIWYTAIEGSGVAFVIPKGGRSLYSENGEFLRRTVVERLHAMTPEQRLQEAFRLHLMALSFQRAGQAYQRHAETSHAHE